LDSITRRYSECLFTSTTKTHSWCYDGRRNKKLKLKAIIFVSHSRVGWVSIETEAGDMVCVLDGARVPFILRPVAGRDGVFSFLLHGEDVSDGGHDIVLVWCLRREL
jgi:hypothetical protein